MYFVLARAAEKTKQGEFLRKTLQEIRVGGANY